MNRGDSRNIHSENVGEHQPGQGSGARSQFRRRWRVRRFVVADRSMEPTLYDGAGLVGWRSARARTGQLRVFEHPDRPDFWLVKRVESVHADGTMTVLSDNRDATLADSRTFGPVPVTGSYRVVLRVRPGGT